MTFQTNILSSRLTSTSFRNIQSRDSVESGQFFSIQNGYIFYIFPPSGNQLVNSTYVPLIDAENTDNTVTTIDQWLQHAQSKTEGAVFTMTRLPAVVGPFSFTLDDKTPTLGTDYSVSTGVGAYSDYTLLSFLTEGKRFNVTTTAETDVDYLLVGAGANGVKSTVVEQPLVYTAGAGGRGGEVKSASGVTLAIGSYDIYVGAPGGGDTQFIGNNIGSVRAANGGGAAGGSGSNGTADGIDGGPGQPWNGVTYGGGNGGSGGSGGGGSGSTLIIGGSPVPSNGTKNTGGGGGGGAYYDEDGLGGTGIVILAFIHVKNPTIGALTVPKDKRVGSAAFNLSNPTSDSIGAFTYTSSNAAVARISGSTVTIVGKGTTTITATQAAFGEYNSGSVLGVLMVANNDTSLAVFTVNGTVVTDGSIVNLPAKTASVNVVATLTDLNARVLITGDSILMPGNNLLTVEVTAEDLVTKQEYNVTLSVALSNDTSLSVFTVDGVPVQDGSTVDMKIETTNLTVVATPNYPNAMVNIVILNENKNLMNIRHTLEVTVTAQNGEMTKYTVKLQYLDMLATFNVTSGSGTPTKTYAVTQHGRATPLAGTISRSAADGSNTTTLTLSGNTGLFIQWQQSSDGNTFTNILAATGLTYISTITATTYYRVFVINEYGLTAFTDVLMVEFTRQNPTIGSLIFPANILIGDTFDITAPSSNSNGAFTYTSDNTSVATISGSTVTIVGNGQTIITATQAATEEYNSKIVVGVLMVANNDTSLSVFTVDGFPVEDGRTFTLPYRKSSVSVVATPTDLNATVLITGDSNLVSGINTLTVTVTAEDCTTKIYTVKLQVPYGIWTVQKAMTIFSW